jgi:hypothetical protein
MNQYVLKRAQDGTRHGEGEPDLLADLKACADFEQYAAGGDVAGAGGDFSVFRSNDNGQVEREAYSTPDLRASVGCLCTGVVWFLFDNARHFLQSKKTRGAWLSLRVPLLREDLLPWREQGHPQLTIYPRRRHLPRNQSHGQEPKSSQE